jgi:hypothetical protein
LKSKATKNGYVDGAWWPRTDDLTAELPDLFAVLSVRLGRIDRLLYNLEEWARPPATITSDGWAVHLDGYRYQPANSIDVHGLNRSTITLLVVPPHTDPVDAHETMMAAAGRTNTSAINDLLTISLQHTPIHTQQPAPADQQRWEYEGGAATRQSVALSDFRDQNTGPSSSA